MSENPPGTVPGLNCGAQVDIGHGLVATCSEHGLGHYDPVMRLSWPGGEGRLVAKVDEDRTR